MTQEEKQLLLIDLCARLPYKVVVTDETEDYLLTSPFLYRYIEMGCKPYLRPMSSMTEEEKEEFIKFRWTTNDGEPRMYEWCDYANANHLDYRGLIEKGLAIEAPEGMYK